MSEKINNGFEPLLAEANEVFKPAGESAKTRGASLFPVESGYRHSLPGLVPGSARALACGG